jgi:hypothetical protein
MKIISFITDFPVIRQILEHLNLWTQKPSKDPPDRNSSTENPVLESLDRGNELTYEPFYDLSACNAQAGDWPGYEEPRLGESASGTTCIMAN